MNKTETFSMSLTNKRDKHTNLRLENYTKKGKLENEESKDRRKQQVINNAFGIYYKPKERRYIPASVSFLWRINRNLN